MKEPTDIPKHVSTRGEEIIEELRRQVLKFGNDYRLAKTAGMGQPTIQRFATGQRPSVRTITKLIAFFGGTIRYKGAPVEGGQTRSARRKKVTRKKR